MIIVIVTCLVLAVLITLWTSGPGGAGPENLQGQMWVKCANEKCGASYEMGRSDFYVQLKDYIRDNPGAPGDPALICEKCGERSIFRAIKCEKCGEVFFPGEAGPNDFQDRCPKCGHSKKQARRDARLRNK